MIYLDNAATTRVFDGAIECVDRAMRETYFNPNATYKSGVAARDEAERARAEIARAIGAYPEEIIFTSCATESNNWVFACGRKNKKGNIVITAGEHASVYETAMQLKSRGEDVRIAPLDKSGAVDRQKLLELVDENTALVSVIHVSNETGVINPVRELCAKVKNKAPKALFHSDGVQAALKTEPVNSLGVDYYSISAHKLGAPKGIGLLYVRRGLNLAPLLYGGGQERGLRSGTQNTPYISAFAQAVKEFTALDSVERTTALRNEVCAFFEQIGCKTVGSAQNSSYIACINVPDVKAEILQNIAHDSGVIIGKGAACSGSKRGNRVLSAMGLSAKEIECCIRISFTADTSRDEAMKAAHIIAQCIQKIRSEHVG